MEERRDSVNVGLFSNRIVERTPGMPRTERPEPDLEESPVEPLTKLPNKLPEADGVLRRELPSNERQLAELRARNESRGSLLS